eukprot:Sspe_Gene.32815::Locus_16068_Transcript_1_3_Confidence_0.500_Length_2362::g.32815::m.32815
MACVVLGGGRKSGKTSLWRTAVGKPLDAEYTPTAEPVKGEVAVDFDGGKVEVALWDMPGDKDSPPETPTCVLLVTDGTQEGVEALGVWESQLSSRVVGLVLNPKGETDGALSAWKEAHPKAQCFALPDDKIHNILASLVKAAKAKPLVPTPPQCDKPIRPQPPPKHQKRLFCGLEILRAIDPESKNAGLAQLVRVADTINSKAKGPTPPARPIVEKQKSPKQEQVKEAKDDRTAAHTPASHIIFSVTGIRPPFTLSSLRTMEVLTDHLLQKREEERLVPDIYPALGHLFKLAEEERKANPISPKSPILAAGGGRSAALQLLTEASSKEPS